MLHDSTPSRQDKTLRLMDIKPIYFDKYTKLVNISNINSKIMNLLYKKATT